MHAYADINMTGMTLFACLFIFNSPPHRTLRRCHTYDVAYVYMYACVRTISKRKPCVCVCVSGVENLIEPCCMAQRKNAASYHFSIASA